MTPIEQRNELLAGKVIKSLNTRHVDGYYCATSADAIRQVMQLMPEGSSISWGGSMTLRDMGLTSALHEAGTYTLFDRDLAKSPEEAQEVYRQAFSADFYLSSANAMSEQGDIVNIDGNGNRVAAIAWGPKKVIFVVGVNKIAKDLDAAIKRARGTAAPINTVRLNRDTPCTLDGVCHDCHSANSICNQIHIIRNSYDNGRFCVVIVGEELGY